MTTLAAVDAPGLAAFFVVLGITLGTTFVASRRTRTATDYWAAGRSVSGLQNGLAISGDFLSAATVLGGVGLAYLFGFDVLFYQVPAFVGFLLLLLILSDRLRNAGRFTTADLLAMRLRERPARLVSAAGTLAVIILYLIAQLVGAGVLIEALIGLPYWVAVLATAAFTTGYVVFGGMLATTWVQIIKAVLMGLAVVVLAILVLERFDFSVTRLVDEARAASPHGGAYLQPGLFLTSPLDAASLSLAFVFGVLGLPHILIRFFTVPDARAARSCAFYTTLIIGGVWILIGLIGFGARAILGTEGEKPAGEGGNLAAPVLAEALGGGAGSLGGDLLFAVVAAIAFATILAVVAGLLISASGTFAHDVWPQTRGRDADDAQRLIVGRGASICVGVLGIVIALLAGGGLNVAFLIGLTFSVAASVNFPVLLLSLTWRGFTATGAVCGAVCGLVSSVALIVVSPDVWPGDTGSPIGWTLANPGIVSIPLGFAGCVLGSLLGRERASVEAFSELQVRAESGLGAEPSGRIH